MEKKLSDLTPFDITFRATKQDIEAIVWPNYIKLLDKSCDVGIVFGGVSMYHRLDEAHEQYLSERVRRFLLTGGIGFLNLDRKTPEAVKMEKYLRSKGVPDSDIIIEPKSRNSIENVLFSIDLLKKCGIDPLQANIGLITSDFHMGRCMAMMAQQLGQCDNLYGVPVVDGITDKEHWIETLGGQRIIWQEAMLLGHNARKGRLENRTVSGLTLARRRK